MWVDIAKECVDIAKSWVEIARPLFFGPAQPRLAVGSLIIAHFSASRCLISLLYARNNNATLTPEVRQTAERADRPIPALVPSFSVAVAGCVVDQQADRCRSTVAAAGERGSRARS
jgi:hypothetical protein